MDINVVTICVNYSDFLKRTLPTTMPHMNSTTIITAPFDTETIKVARDFGCKLFVTDAFYKDGDAFNKGRALENFFDDKIFSPSDWVLMLDADIALPPNARHAIESQVVNTNYLYGASRLVCPNVQGWENVGTVGGGWNVSGLKLIKEREIAGFFQLFWNRAMQRPWFSTDWGHAGGYDSVFEQRWGKNKQWIDLNVVHLGEFRKDWFGRVSESWDGESIHNGPSVSDIKKVDKKHREIRSTGVKAIDAKWGKLE